MDYVAIFSKTTAPGTLIYDDRPLLLGVSAGGGGFDGWLDEVRFSAGVLYPSQFLSVAHGHPP